MNIFRNRFFYYSVAILLLLCFAAYYWTAFLLELWWFDTLDLAYFFVTREIYRDLIVLAVTFVFTLLIFINFKIIPRLMTNEQRGALTKNNVSRSGKLPGFFSKKILLPLSVAMTIPVLIPVYDHWEDFLLYFFSSASTLQDPVYGRDISYYLFSFPVYTLIQNKILLVFSLLFSATAFFYWRSYRNQKQDLNNFPQPAKVHLTVLIVVLVCIQAWSISFQRTELLYESRHDPVFYGPGVVEMTYQLPLIWLTFFAFLAVAGNAIYFIYSQRGKKWLIGFAGFFLLLLGFRQISLLPELIDKYYVQANPVQTEEQYIRNNIRATLDAFGLNNIEKIDYPVISSLTPDVSTEIFEELYNVPLWDHQLLQNVFEQLQAIRPYYTFSPVAVDRYNLGGREYQINIAARELTLDKLPSGARNWENRHMKYTHGYGVVATPAAQQANQPMQWFLSEVSLQTQFAEFKLQQADIYYGLADYAYAIVPNKAPKPDSAGVDMNSDYHGSGGLKVSSLFMKMIFSAFMGDEKIFFSRSITNQSKILFRRNIIKRIKAIAPFLKPDADPYAVIVNNKIYWIVDAYTTSDRYPLVKPIPSPFYEGHADDPNVLNYVRNSVKIIVDAYNGSVDFYIADPQDPIVSAYQRAYPTLFKTISEIPEQFIKHLSYPQNLFTLQMAVYSRYHQTDPEVFYQQNETLEFAKTDNKAVAPYYLTIDILDKPDTPESEREKFILMSPLSPISMDNLHSIAIAGCLRIDKCNQHYAADIYFYTFPKALQIDGPAQISALIEQNPDISKQFTLWDQRGSKVIKGRMLVIPVERSIIYIQPVYLAATAKTGFPQLAKIIIAMNQQTAMGDSVASAYKQLEQKQRISQ